MVESILILSIVCAGLNNIVLRFLANTKIKYRLFFSYIHLKSIYKIYFVCYTTLYQLLCAFVKAFLLRITQNEKGNRGKSVFFCKMNI